MDERLTPDTTERVDLRSVGSPSTRAGRTAEAFYGGLVQAASAAVSVESYPTPLPCRRRDRGRACPGRLVVRRQDIPATVRWSCPTCGDGGEIEGWRGTVWDLSRRPPVAGPDETGETVEVLLTEEEWRFLRDGIITIDPEVERRIAAARLTDRGVQLAGTEEDLEGLAGNVAFEANHTRSRPVQRMCETILDRLDEALGVEDPPLDLAGINAALARQMEAYNQTPQEELGGLSPEQAFHLLHADWDSTGSAMAIARDLPLAELQGAPLLVNARRFLDLLSEEGGTRVTTAGNLNRAFVRRMFEVLDLPAGERPMLLRRVRQMNEQDVWPLHVVRVVLVVAGLVKRRKGTFSLTREGERLRSEERAGELYARLFTTHFQRLNLAYLDGWGPGLDSLQSTIPYTFFRFAEAGGSWHTPEEVVDRLILQSVRDEIPETELIDMRAHVLEARVLRPLVSFGLAEVREPPASAYGPRRYRKSRLYDRFLEFRV